MRHRIYYDGKVHVIAERCKTCVFHPGNRMHMTPGRVREMVKQAASDESGSIVCHSTLHLPSQAICRGWWDTQPHGTPLQIAERLGAIEEVAAV